MESHRYALLAIESMRPTLIRRGLIIPSRKKPGTGSHSDIATGGGGSFAFPISVTIYGTCPTIGATDARRAGGCTRLIEYLIPNSKLSSRSFLARIPRAPPRPAMIPIRPSDETRR